MINKKIEKICNEQVKKEGYSSHLYLAMASWAETKGYPGIADWFYAQSNEERIHMLKFIKFINERGGKAVLPVIDEPPANFDSVLDAFNKTLTHEEFITDSINEIVALCLQEKDFTTHNWVQWFVNEQIQEEASARQVIDKLRLVGEANLYIFDRDIMALRSLETKQDTVQ